MSFHEIHMVKNLHIEGVSLRRNMISAAKSWKEKAQFMMRGKLLKSYKVED